MTLTPESVQQDLTSEDFGDRLRGVNNLRQLAPEIAFNLAVPVVTDPNVRVRYAVVSQMATLGVVNPAQSLELLRDRLHNDPEADVKSAAADGIGALKLTDGFEDLKQVYTNTNDWMLQMSVIAGLGEMGDPRGFELLKDAIACDEPLVQLAAVSAFGELGNPEAVTILLSYIDSDDWQIRQRLVQAFSKFQTDEARSALEKLAQDKSDQVASYAKDCLQQL